MESFQAAVIFVKGSKLHDYPETLQVGTFPLISSVVQMGCRYLLFYVRKSCNMNLWYENPNSKLSCNKHSKECLKLLLILSRHTVFHSYKG